MPDLKRPPECSREIWTDRDHRAVLSISESQLMVKYPDGETKKLAEVGNIRWSSGPRLIEYSPEEGFLVNVSRREVVGFPSDVLFKIKHDLGFVSAKELFGDQVRNFSEGEFDSRYHEVARLSEKKIELIKTFLQTAGVDVSRVFNHDLMSRIENWSKEKRVRAATKGLPDENEDGWKKRQAVQEKIWCEPFQPSGNEFAKLVAEYLLEDLGSNLLEGKKEIIRLLFNCSSLMAKDFIELQKSSVDLFYLFARLGDFKIETMEENLDVLNHYPLSKELLLEFQRQPDVRFGSLLLFACEQEARREAEEKAKGTW